MSLIMTISCDRKPAYRIGVSQCSGGEWRDKLNDEMRREALFADEYKIDIDIKCADDDPQLQTRQLKELVASGADVIVVSPTESGEVDAAIRDITRSGKPVVVFDRGTTHNDYTAFVGADNREIGRQAAIYANSIFNGPIRALEIMGNMRTSPARERSAGFRSAADSLPNLSIVAAADARWDGAIVLTVVDSLLKSHPEVNLIFAHNDPMAISAATKLEELGRRPQVKVIGVDGSPEFGLKAVMEGKIDATILYPTMGHEIMGTALAIARGDSVAKINTSSPIPVINRADAPMYLLQHQALMDETANIIKAKTTFDNLYEQHSVQQTFFIVLIVITLLLIIFLILFFRQYRKRKALSDRLAEQNEELKELNADLKEATRSKINFFTNVSHDLRTPLTLISASVDRVSADGNLTDSQKTYMRLADKNARMLTRLINQILDFSRFEESSIPLHLRETNLREMADEFSLGFRAMAVERGLTFRTLFDAPTGFSMALDQEKIERVIYNLFSNSFKFTPKGGTVTFEISVDARQSALTCRVSDTGRGMGRDELNRLFERHFTSDVDNPFGSGIGMTIAQAFVELHGGSISADSEKGKGTVITFMIPVRHVADKPVPMTAAATEKYIEELSEVEATPPVPDEDSQTLLIIDDTKDIRELIVQLFGDRFTVIQAASGEAGIRMAEEYVPDVIICDIMMPDMDGLETCRRLKDNISTSHIPVLMLTACALDEQRTAGYANGADMYLCKPFDSEMLFRMVDSLIANRRRVLESPAASKSAKSAESSTPVQAGPQDVTVPKIESQFYNTFLREFEASMSDTEISVEQIAERMNMSRVQLYRKLKARTSCSPTDLMRRLRLKKAKELLAGTDLTVSEIAYKVGFSSVSYFSKCYRELYGNTPTETRK